MSTEIANWTWAWHWNEYTVISHWYCYWLCLGVAIPTLSHSVAVKVVGITFIIPLSCPSNKYIAGDWVLPTVGIIIAIIIIIIITFCVVSSYLLAISTCFFLVGKFPPTIPIEQHVCSSSYASLDNSTFVSLTFWHWSWTNQWKVSS